MFPHSFSISQKVRIALLLSCTLCTFATQALVISGTISDDPYPSKRFSVPVSNAKIYFQSPSSVLIATPYITGQPIVMPPVKIIMDSITTDTQGKFSYTGLARAYDMTIVHPHYATRGIVINPRIDTSIDVTVVSKNAHAKISGKVLTLIILTKPTQTAPIAMPPPPIDSCFITVSFPRSSDQIIDIPSITTTTDSLGAYSFDSIPLSYNVFPVTITVSKVGYRTIIKDTVISTMATIAYNPALIPAPAANGDSVYTDPSAPSIMDNITFHLYDASACCCGEFVERAMTYDDTAIYLNYQLNDSLCKLYRCIAAGSRTTFTGKIPKAGTYSIYNAQQFYCPTGRMCPAIYMLPTKIGKLTVLPEVSVEQANAHRIIIPTMASSKKNGIIQISYSPTVSDNNASITISTIAGKLIYKSGVSAGSTRHLTTVPFSGLYVVTLSTNKGIVYSQRLSVIK